ncbi:MAG: type IV pilin protein [Prochlorothrix sp.]
MTLHPRPPSHPRFLLPPAKAENEGFTLIELPVVIIIIGVLSAIALPSFLNQANKARESEGKQYIGSMNRAQQAYFLERQRFTSSMSNLGLGIQTSTSNYSYSLHVFASDNTLNLGTPPNEKSSANLSTYQSAIANVGHATNTTALRSLVGAVDVMLSQAGLRSQGDGTIAILCQSQGPADPHINAVVLEVSTVNTDQPTCSENDGFEILQ